MKRKKETSSVSKSAGKKQAADLTTDYKKTIENHKQAANHYTEAAKHHLEAAKFYAKGNVEKAAHSSMLAWGHHAIAGDFITDDAKHHVQMLKRTIYL